MIRIGVLVASLALTGGAQASSILQLGSQSAPAATPSITTLGALPSGRDDGKSIVALGEAVPPVTYEQVSAVPKSDEPASTLMVIRGGEVGGASGIGPAAAPVEPAQAASQAASGEGAATPPAQSAAADAQPTVPAAAKLR